MRCICGVLASLRSCSAGKGTNIVVASTGHRTDDDLLYFRLSQTIRDLGYKVTLMGKPSEVKPSKGIALESISRCPSRIARFLVGPLVFALKWCKDPGDTTIIASPDLLAISVILRLVCPRKRFFYFALENYGDKIGDKQWIPCALRPLLNVLLPSMEVRSASRLDAVMVTDRATARRFRNSHMAILPNYPHVALVQQHRLREGERYRWPRAAGGFRAVYSGRISNSRGLTVLLDAIRLLPDDYELHLYGWAEPTILGSLGQSAQVYYHGVLSWPEVLYEIAKYDVGLCVFQRGTGYENAAENTTKLFEYMLCSVPVIVSDFAGLKSIVMESGSGLCVDPDEPRAVAEAIEVLRRDPESALRMGRRGHEAVISSYCWENVIPVLSDLLNSKQGSTPE